jgi:hypothetical protein
LVDVDGQTLASVIGLATAVFSAFVALVRWAVTRIAKSHDDAATRSVAAQDRATDAIVDNTRVTTRLVGRLENMDSKLDELRGVKPKKRAQTSPGVRSEYREPLRVVPEDED